MLFMLEGLAVNAKRMYENLNLTSGLIIAEAVMMKGVERHCDPVNYIGLSGKIVDHVLGLNRHAQRAFSTR